MTIDTGLSTTSTNPVQNKVITQALGTRAPLTSLTTLSTTVSSLSASVTAETTARTAQYNAMISTLQSYINAQIAAANWMTRAQIQAFADDELTSIVSKHNVSTTAHQDIRDLIAGAVTSATFEAHTSGGYNPVTDTNDALHVTLSDKVNWNAAADAVDDHLDPTTSATIHITAAERVKWNSASQTVSDHTGNAYIHVTESDKNTWTAAANGYASHVLDVTSGYTSPHVTYSDRVAWDKMVTDLAEHVADRTLASSLHLHSGERASWNAAKTTADTHVLNDGIHVTASDRESWTGLADDVTSHIAVTSGNPHGTSASDVGAYTVDEANAKVATEKASMLSTANSAAAALVAGGIVYRGAVDTLAELNSITSYKHGDAYLVNEDSTYSYVDADGNTQTQACLYVCQVSDGGVKSWIPFSEPFKVNLNTFDTKASAQERIDEAVETHDEDANAHKTVIDGVKDALNQRMAAIETSVSTLSASATPISTFNSHKNNTQNPHAVTAAQVGTLTETEIETLVDSAESSAKSYAQTQIKSIASSTLKWRGSFEFPVAGSGVADPLVAKSKHKDASGNYTAWRRGAANTDADEPKYGDCYTETGTGRMFVFTGIPADVDLDTEADPTTISGYTRFGWDDVGNILDTATIIATAITQARALVETHNTDENAHSSIRTAVAAYSSDITVGGETYHGVIPALEALLTKYQALGTVRQSASLVTLVNELYEQYTTKQNKLTEGMGIKLTNYDASGNALAAGVTAGIATTEIAWDPSDMIGEGLAYTNGVLSCTYNTKTVVTQNEDGTTTSVKHVVLGETYATLDWVSDYVSGLMTKDAVDEVLAKKQDKLTAGTGIAIFSVMDTSHNGIKVDEEGNTVYKQVQSTDSDGNPVYDADGNAVYVYVQKRDADGNALYDSNGDPIYEEEEDEDLIVADTTHLEVSTIAEDEQVLELTKLLLQDHVTGDWYSIKIDEDGDLTSVEVE